MQLNSKVWYYLLMPEKELIHEKINELPKHSSIESPQMVSELISNLEPLVDAPIEWLLDTDWDRKCVVDNLYDGIKKHSKQILKITNFDAEEIKSRLEETPCYSNKETIEYLQNNGAIIPRSQSEILELISNRLNCSDIKIISAQENSETTNKALLTFPIVDSFGKTIGFSHTLIPLSDSIIITEKALSVTAEDILISGIESKNASCISLNALTNGTFRLHHYDTDNQDLLNFHEGKVTFASVATKEVSSQFITSPKALSGLFHEVGHQLYEQSLGWISLINQAQNLLKHPTEPSLLNPKQARIIKSIDERSAWNIENRLKFFCKQYIGVDFSTFDYFSTLATGQEWFLSTYDFFSYTRAPLSGAEPYYSTLARRLGEYVITLKNSGQDISTYNSTNGENLSIHPLLQLIEARIDPNEIAAHSGLPEALHEILIERLSTIYQTLG